jgi:hypothetical protein
MVYIYTYFNTCLHHRASCISYFPYADDLVITAQGHTFSEIELTLTHTLEKLDRYYTQNSLKPNPTKTQVHFTSTISKQERNLKYRGGAPILNTHKHPRT